MTRNALLYFLLRVGSLLVPYLPVRVAYALASAAGACAFHLFRKPRRAITANLAVVLALSPNAPEVRATARRAFENDARNWVDTLRISRLSHDQITRAVEVDGWQHIIDSLDGEKGLVLVGLHLGNFDLVGQVLAARHQRVTVPVEHMRPERLFKLLLHLRTSQGINAVPLDRAPREMLRALHRGEMVAVTADRHIAGKGIEVEFFGRKAILPRGPVSLARHSGAPVIVACGVRLHRDHFQAFVTAPLPMQRSDNPDADENFNANQIAETMADFIRQFPDQWLMFSPVWDAHFGANAPDTIDQYRGAAV